MRMLKLPDGRIRLLVQGLSRVRIDSFLAETPVAPREGDAHRRARGADASLRGDRGARRGASKEALEKTVTLGKSISPEVMVVAAGLDDPARLADLAASNLELKIDEAQKILETDPGGRPAAASSSRSSAARSAS